MVARGIVQAAEVRNDVELCESGVVRARRPETPARDPRVQRLVCTPEPFEERLPAFVVGHDAWEPISARVRSSFGAETYRKLVALKDKYDPTNLLRRNQNIRPSAKSSSDRTRVTRRAQSSASSGGVREAGLVLFRFDWGHRSR
jgi:hypothetical protein